MSKENAVSSLALGRASAEKKTPYFMQGVYGLVPYAAPGIGTMGVTKNLVLIYDPEWTMKLPVDECANTLIHEAIHVYFKHCERIEVAKMEPQMGNICADLSANGLMEEMGLKLPHGYYPKDFGLPNGETIEWYHEQLTKNPDNKKKIKKLQKDLQGGDAGDGEGDADSDGDPGSSGADGPEEGEGTGSSTSNSTSGAGKKPGVGSGRCGGIAGNPIDKELEAKADKECGRSQAEQKAIQQRIEVAIEKHIEKHGRGSMPSAFQEKMPQQEKKSQVNWRQELKHVAMKVTGRMESGGLDFSLSLPSKASYARGIPRPGMVQMQPEAAFIVDTSGSMGARQILDGIREIVAVMKTAGIEEAWFLEADAGVAAKPKRIRLRNLLREIDIHGRGGTNFDPALQECMKLRPRPDIVFYVTDGDGYVTYRPPIPVVWVIVKSYFNKSPAKWGYTVFVDMEEEDGTDDED